MAKKHAHIQKYIELLAANQDPALTLSLLKSAPDSVIKTICNAAFNLTNGSIDLTPKQNKFFRKYKHPISKLVQPHHSIKHKKKVLIQKGGGFFIPLLLSAVLPLVTSLLTGR